LRGVIPDSEQKTDPLVDNVEMLSLISKMSQIEIKPAMQYK